MGCGSGGRGCTAHNHPERRGHALFEEALVGGGEVEAAEVFVGEAVEEASGEEGRAHLGELAGEGDREGH